MRVASLIFAIGVASSQTLTLPQPSFEGISRGQPFDRNVPDAAVYDGHVYFVWGSRLPKSRPPAVNSKYLPYARDVDRKHTLEWYKTNHPDWIEYQADRLTPAYGFVYPAGSAMSIDITNPAVREFYFNTYVAPFVGQGYPMFAFDNVNLTNWDQRSGHFDAQGKWVQQFSGERIDPAYIASVLDWMEYLTARLHASGIGVAANITFPLGKPDLFPSMRKLVATVDLWADEQGFTIHRDSNLTGEQWQQKFDFIRQLPAQKYHWAINEMTTKHLAEASQSQIDYAVANYYLYRERNSMLSVCGVQEYGGYVDTPAMHVNLGHPTADPVHDAGGAWTRTYEKGLVIVNSAAKPRAVVSLPAGTWVDSHGKEYAGKLEIPFNNGMMLSAASAPEPVRITILGDSIDADQPAERPVQGWGTFLESNLQNARVANYASSGRSTKTYLHGETGKDGKHIEPKFWNKAQATPADYWIIKFGGNDSHPATEEKHTDPDTDYAANLKVFIETARKLGVKPILVTPFRRPFRTNGQLSAELEPYAEAARRVAKEEKVPLIDLYAHATEWFTSLGPQRLQAYVPKELGGHTNRAGANSLAQWMAQQLVQIVPAVTVREPLPRK